MKFIFQISNEVPFVQPSSQHKLKNSASCFRECVNDESCAVVAIGDESLFVAQEHERNCLMYSNRSVLLQTEYEERWKVYAKVLILSIYIYLSIVYQTLIGCGRHQYWPQYLKLLYFCGDTFITTNFGRS